MKNEEQLRWLSDEYYELNGSHHDIIDAPPTALQFSRIAHIARPVVIKGFEIPASTRWTNAYLAQQMGSRPISVAVTPDGRADAVTRGPGGRLYFAEPHTQKMTMAEFLSKLGAHRGPEIHYLQSQNGNMYTAGRDFHQAQRRPAGDGDGDAESEFEPLRADVPSEVPWCSAAFDRRPDAVNLWIGDGRSVTSIHSDPYENIYTVVRGSKHFTLLPPTEGWCLQERTYPHATYTRASPTAPLALRPSPAPTAPVRWSSLRAPHRPGALPAGAHPLHITLRAGETLYLPAGWWHHVRQSGDVVVAVNWWYDVESRGMMWLWLGFLRGVGDVPAGNEEEGDGEDGGEVTSV